MADIGRKEEDEDHGLGENGAEKDGGAANVAEKKGDEKQAKNAAVKNRRENIARLDEIFDQAAKRRDGDRDDAPAEGQPARRDDVMMVGSAGSKNAIEIDGGRGSKRVQDG